LLIIALLALIAFTVARALMRPAQLAGHGSLDTETANVKTWKQLSDERYELSTINPGSGLPMVGNSMVDVAGDTYGYGNSTWD
jgi:hypothetical protein